jgi:predicted XRE-type DNA-binding protein
MSYSNREIIKRVEKAKRQKKQLTHITDKSKLSTEDKMKLSLCKHFVQFANSKRLKLKDVADMIDVPIQRLSEITNYKINKYTVDQLIKNLSLLAKHDAQIREYLVFLEQATELPALSVTETRKLTRDLRDAAVQHANL